MKTTAEQANTDFLESLATMLRPRIEDIVAEKVAAQLKAMDTKKQPENDQYLTRAEVCKMLKISLPTLHSMVNRGLLRKYKAQGRTIFKAVEIERAVSLGVTKKYIRP